MEVHIFDFRWSDTNTVEFQAYKDTKFGKKKLNVGDHVSLQCISDTLRCAGHMADGQWHPCPDSATGKPKCDVCRVKEGNFAITMFDGFNTENFRPEELSLLAQDAHYVYLALFDTDIVKVGVTKEPRKELRQVEQGAAFTLYIAHTPDGILARQIETLVRRSGMADKIKSSQKKNFVIPEISTSEAKAYLMEFIPDIEQAVFNYPRLKKHLITPAEFACWDKNYDIQTVKDSDLPFHPVKLEQGEWVSGTIQCIKGPFVMINTGEEIVSICAKDLRGMQVEFDEKPHGLSLNTALQNTLF